MIGTSLLVQLALANNTQSRNTGSVMLIQFVFTLGFSGSSHQSHIIIQGVAKFGMDHLLEGFLRP